MRTYRIPLLRWFLMAPIFAVLPAAIFAWPIGFCIYIVGFILVGGPGGEASQFSKMCGEALFVPVAPFSLLFPNPGGNLNHALLVFGFPYAWLLFTIILLLLGFSRWNRSTVEPSQPPTVD